MGAHSDSQRRLDVWMDGSCRLCQVSRAWCETRDPDARVRFIDFRAANGNELPLAREDHESTMWVRDRDGALLDGFAAWRRIMAEMPGWRWVARLASLPPLTLVGPPLYRLIASNRRFFSR